MDRMTTTASSHGHPLSSGMGSTFRAIAQGTSIDGRQRTRTVPPEAVRPGVGGGDASDSWRLAV
jgi:hypothetical protein